MKRLLFITPLLSFLLLFLGCKKEDDSNAQPDDNKGKKEPPEISVWDISKETKWDLMVLGTKNKDRYYIEETNSKPTKAIYYSEKKDNHYSVKFDNEGLPDKIVVDNYIFVFENHSGNKVDIGVVKPNDETEIIRDVETEDFNWDKIKAGLGKKARNDEEVVKWTSRALEAIPCAISIAATVGTFGGAAPSIAVTCGTYLLGLGADIAAENTDIKALEEGAETYDMASTGIDCASGNWVGCASGAASEAVSTYGDDFTISTGSVKEVENKLEDSGGSKNKWVEKAEFKGSKRLGAVSFSLNGKGYIGTGKGATGLKEDFWRYNPKNNSWTQIASFSGSKRKFAIGFSINSKGYVGTGKGPNGLKEDFWSYNPKTNNWKKEANFKGGKRVSAVGFSINNKGYIGTGYDGSARFKDLWQYDPASNTWERKSEMPSYYEREKGVSFATEKYGYVGLGYEYPSLGGGGMVLSNFYQYDPQSDSWKQIKSFPEQLWQAVAFSINNKGYVGLGVEFTSSKNYKKFWEYDPNKNSWSRISKYNGDASTFSVAFTINGSGYVGTGGPTYSKQFWKYIP